MGDALSGVRDNMIARSWIHLPDHLLYEGRSCSLEIPGKGMLGVAIKVLDRNVVIFQVVWEKLVGPLF